uniref:PDZ domain-containing protein n=1 Tax=Macrostomum lignano TaxID=282301 RepID=A0A1I8FE12_9PLAT
TPPPPSTRTTVTLTRRQDEGFGIVIVSSVTRPPAGSGGGVVLGEFIGHIIDGSPASRCDKLRPRRPHPGRQWRWSGRRVHHEDIVRMVRDSGLQGSGRAGLPVQRLPGTGQRPGGAPGGLFTAVLHKTDKGFGFSIRGGAEFNQIAVLRAADREGGGAHQSGRLRVGDEIVSINDRPLAADHAHEAIQVIRGRPDPPR